MKNIDPGHQYTLDGYQTVRFIKRVNGELVHAGTTNEELLEVLLDRTKYLNDKFPCIENEEAILYMQKALDAFNLRTKRRVEQGVETKDIAHKSD